MNELECHINIMIVPHPLDIKEQKHPQLLKHIMSDFISYGT